MKLRSCSSGSLDLLEVMVRGIGLTRIRPQKSVINCRKNLYNPVAFSGTDHQKRTHGLGIRIADCCRQQAEKTPRSDARCLAVEALQSANGTIVLRLDRALRRLTPASGLATSPMSGAFMS